MQVEEHTKLFEEDDDEFEEFESDGKMKYLSKIF